MTSRADHGPGASAAIAGLALAATIALPIASGERSLLWAILEAFSEDWLNGVFAGLVIGAPYLVGACLALAVVLRSSLSVVLLRVPITILYIEMVCLALLLVRDSGDAVAPWSFIGFVLVSTLSAVSRFSRDRRHGRTPSVAWLGRWGAMLVAGLFGWFLLQVLVAGEAQGVISPWATFGAALLVAATCRPKSG
ncbi:MAG: hypothetical protein AAF721_34205 [Myxococcota bacterium]